jgi:hypothetical protein
MVDVRPVASEAREVKGKNGEVGSNQRCRSTGDLDVEPERSPGPRMGGGKGNPWTYNLLPVDIAAGRPMTTQTPLNVASIERMMGSGCGGEAEYNCPL